MMKKYEIKNPCHEDWNDMTPISGGKHCDVCFKKVWDFTNNSDEEIDKILKINEDSIICSKIQEERIIPRQFILTF